MLRAGAGLCSLSWSEAGCVVWVPGSPVPLGALTRGKKSPPASRCCPGVLCHSQSHMVSAPRSSEVPRLLFQTFIFTDGEDEELKKQARESVALVPLCV